MKIYTVNAIKLFTCIVLCLLAGVIGSFFTQPAIPGWYATLNKPTFTPPNWVFQPVWTFLYITMGIAAFLIWKKGLNHKPVKIALSIFLIQLFLNSIWSIAFFGFQSPLAGLMIIVFLWIAILATMISFYKISKLAVVLLIPYIFWVSFAAVLNYYLYILNR
ncbi:MAG: tryptophan-rich sensory protein [bacterium]|nr:tryptophan-rich sensory protein [bacterium]